LHSFGFTPTFIGVCFAVPGIIYAALAPLMYLFTARAPKRAVILLGVLLLAVGMFFIGTSKSFGLENNPAMIMIGLMIFGGSLAIMSIPVLPEMMEAVETLSLKHYNGEELDNYISGVFVVSNGIGEAIGPILSAHLNDDYGFREAQDIFAFGILIYAVIYFIFAGHINMLFRTRKERNLTEQVEPKHTTMEDDEVVDEAYTLERKLEASKSHDNLSVDI